MSKDQVRPFRPSNSSEGDWFMSEWCERCRKDTEDEPCPILMASMAYGVDEPGYPAAWVTDESGPRCTAFLAEGEEAPEPQYKSLPGQAALPFGDADA